MAKYARNLGGMVPLPPGYAYGYKKRMKKKNSTFLMFNLPDKKLATTQDSQPLQNSDEKQYCQYWMLRLVAIN